MPSSKKGGKQFRRSRKRKDRKLADRRLKEIKEQIGGLSLGDDSRAGIETVANRWLESIQHTLAPGTIQQRQIRIKNIASFFKGASLRNITPFQCQLGPNAPRQASRRRDQVSNSHRARNVRAATRQPKAAWQSTRRTRRQQDNDHVD